MHDLIIGVGHVGLYLRHAETSKDKRNILKSLIQKLRNQGFSVTESTRSNDPKQASIGFVFAGNSATGVDKALQETKKIFVGDFDVQSEDSEVFDYSDTTEPEKFFWEK